jgi:hypothetical protein
MGYRLVRLVIRILLNFFYGSSDVVGREGIPATGPRLAAMDREP